MSLHHNAVLHAVCGLYQDDSYPYETGPLFVDEQIYSPTTRPLNPPPIHTKVYWPEDDIDTYAVLYYVTGFSGITPGAIYDDVMSNISSHGYVVLSAWALVGDDGPEFSFEKHLENLDWFEVELAEDLGADKASFSDVAVGCHSAGCRPTLHMAMNRTEQIKALLNLEPVSNAIKNNIPERYLPSFSMGAELANMSCSFPGRDFITWYNYLSCPKIMLEVAEVGHCDLLDYEFWLACSVSEFCPFGEESNLQAYRALVAGMSSAFLTAYVQGNMAQLDYVTDPEQVPWTLLMHQTDIDC